LCHEVTTKIIFDMGMKILYKATHSASSIYTTALKVGEKTDYTNPLIWEEFCLVEDSFPDYHFMGDCIDSDIFFYTDGTLRAYKDPRGYGKGCVYKSRYIPIKNGKSYTYDKSGVVVEIK
jgi:hypothetical protein